MDSRHGKIRMNVERDRLSNLSDDLIHKILSFISIKHAIGTSALSSRWRYIWTSMPCLNFSSDDFRTLPEFSEFVTHVLSRRNNQIEVSSVKLTYSGKGSQVPVKRILDYAFSHNAQQLNITFVRERMMSESPLYVFSSQSLKYLTLTECAYRPTWELPSLTTLNLYRVKFYYSSIDECASLLSNCANLKTLTFKQCMMPAFICLNICHPRLSSLTLEDGACKGVNVLTPQLKNLTVIAWSGIHLVSTPNLSSLRFKDDYRYGNGLLQLSTELLHLEKADICAHCPYFEEKAYTRKIVHLLQQLHSVKFLTLNLELVKLLSSFVELISHQPSPFTNLKSLKIYTDCATRPMVSMPTEVRNYLLDSSPDTVFTMVSLEETTAVLNVISARNLMRCLQDQLDKLKENNETNTAHMKQDKAPMENHMTTMHEREEAENRRAQPKREMKCHSGGEVAHTHFLLQIIERLLEELPTSHRDKLQARFSGLCAEVEMIMDGMKIQCNKKPNLSNVSFHELATSPHQSS